MGRTTRMSTHPPTLEQVLAMQAQMLQTMVNIQVPQP
jgi:hypothetical protein